MLPLRTLGMLDRWCRMPPAGAIAAERRQSLDSLSRDTADLLSGELADDSLVAGMIATPPRIAAAAQLHATLSSARALAA